MAGVNKVILVGNLGKDPEVRHLENNVAVARFSLATSESYKDRNGQRVEKTEWHNIVLWRGLAEIAEKFLRKGQTVYIEGKLRTNSYQDKDGNTRYTTEIVADNMTMLGGRGGDNTSGSTSEGSAPYNKPEYAPSSSAGAADEMDDLPF